MGDGWRMGLILKIARHPTPRVDGANDSSAAIMDMHMLDADLLRGLAAIPLQGLERQKQRRWLLRVLDLANSIRQQSRDRKPVIP
jgi:hypothetical protein